MPLDRRFSAGSFMSLEADSESTQRLVRALEAAVVDELRSALQAEMQRIVDELNSLGHHLSLYELSSTGIDYHDVTDLSADTHCQLRLGLDFVVSAGYGDINAV